MIYRNIGTPVYHLGSLVQIQWFRIIHIILILTLQLFNALQIITKPNHCKAYYKKIKLILSTSSIWIHLSNEHFLKYWFWTIAKEIFDLATTLFLGKEVIASWKGIFFKHFMNSLCILYNANPTLDLHVSFVTYKLLMNFNFKCCFLIIGPYLKIEHTLSEKAESNHLNLFNWAEFPDFC